MKETNLLNLAIVFPCYNEGKRFSADLFLSEITHFPEVDFLFVDDGSIDDTFSILNELSKARKNIKVIKLNRNKGKAEAVRYGILNILTSDKYSHVGYFDADLATPLNQLTLFLEHLEQDNAHRILFGSRIKRAGATIQRNQIRHYSGRFITTLVNNSIVKIPVYDTQCGAKIMTVDLAKEVFYEPFISKWLFDIEIIARLQESYNYDQVIKMIYEVPLTVWIEKGNTKIRLKDLMRLPLQLLRIHWKYKSLKNT